MFKHHICNGDCETYFDNFFYSLKEGFMLKGVICGIDGRPTNFRILELKNSFEK